MAGPMPPAQKRKQKKEEVDEEENEEQEEEDAAQAEEETAQEAEEEDGEDEDDGPRKKRKKAAAKGNAGNLKATIAALMQKKKAAAKAEDYVEAMRLKEEIEALQTKDREAKQAVAEEEDPETGSKRPLPKGEKTKKEKEEPKAPAVEELASDPFFDDKTPAFLAPTCWTTGEREAWRAVHTGNIDFLQRKILGSEVPLFCQRDVVSKQTALHLAIEKGNAKAIALLAREAQQCGYGVSRLTTPRKRASSMVTQSTGTMNILCLGFETGKIGAARGGRELNNALVDPQDKPEPLQAVIGRTPLSPDNLKLLMGLSLLRMQVVVRRGKIIFRGGKQEFCCDLTQCLDPAMQYGNLSVVRAVLEHAGHLGVGPGHTAAVSADPLPDKLQGRSIAAKLRFSGKLTPVHLAAINPDASKLAGLLKLEPSALAITTETGLHAIHFAAACEGPAPLKLLLSEWSAERRCIGADKRTPLHFAAAAGRTENVKVLMGGGGIGIGTSYLFAKEIRIVLLRQTPANVKIGMDGICILSRLLVDLLHRVTDEATKRLGASPNLGLKALHQATKAVLKGALAKRIAEKSGKLTVGKLGLPDGGSELLRALSEVSENVLETMFNAIDANGDGKLDATEVRSVFASAGVRLNQKQFKQVIKEMDSDKNGAVSFDEFSSWMEAGSPHAVALRRHLLVGTGEMGQAEIVAAEAAEEEVLQGVDTLAFDARPLLQLLKYGSGATKEVLDQSGTYTSAILECACTKVLEVSANAARSQKKTSVAPEHILNSIKSNEELHGLYQADSVVMNSLLLPARDKEGYTALHAAAEAGHTACVHTLIACGADVDAVGPERKSPLAFAAERGHEGCVRELLLACAKLELSDKRKRTPLLLAVRSGRTVVASILLHHSANPNAADDSGNTIVHYAAAFGWLHCIDLLHKAGAQLSVANAMKLAPITAALQKGHKTVFRRMLELGIDVNFRDADGSTLLLSCLGTVNRMVHEEIQFMMFKNADPALASSVGTTPLHAVAKVQIDGAPNYVAHPFEADRLCRVKGSPARPSAPGAQGKAVDADDDEDSDGNAAPKPPKRLRKDEAEDLNECIYRRGFHQLSIEQQEAVFRLGWTVPAWQAGHNHSVAWHDLIEQEQKAAMILGWDESTWKVVPVRVVIDIRDSNGTFPCVEGMAISATDNGMVSVKVKRDSSVGVYHVSFVLLAEEDMENVWSQTPHVTVAVARLLLENKAVVDARDATGTTPLMWALRTSKKDLALMLLELGADPNAQETAPPVPVNAWQQAPPPRPRSALLDAAQQQSAATLTHGSYSKFTVIAKLLAKGCIAHLPATVVDVSPLLHLINAGELDSASILLDAKADPRADVTGHNALHWIFAKVFELQAAHAPNVLQRAAAALALAKRLLSGALGEELLSALARKPPHVTPLYSLVEAFANQNSGGCGTAQAAEGQTVRAKLLLELLEALPGSVDLSKWTVPPAEPDKCLPPSSPLSLLCRHEFFEHCKELGVAAVTFLCNRGISANASAGSPAALHSLAIRLEGKIASSSLAKVLLPLTDLSAHMPSGDTLLTFTVGKCGKTIGQGWRDSIALLLEARCDPDVRDAPPPPCRPCPALHLASQLRDEGLVTMLLAVRANPNLLDNSVDCRTPLHFAVAAAPAGSDANFDVEEVLLRSGADPVLQDALGYSSLHFAFMKAQDNALAFDGQWLEAIVESENQPPKLKWTQSAWGVIKARIDPIETISSLCVLPGICVNAKDKQGMSPLHLAALRGASISALKLINAGAVIEDQLYGNTPLGLAMHAYPDLAVLLMQVSAKTTANCVLLGAPDSRPPCLGVPESIFSLAVRQVSKLQGSDGKAATYLGAAISAMDCGFPRSQALNDTIRSQLYVMLLTLIPKVGDDVLRSQRFEGGHNLLHRLALSKCDATGADATLVRATTKLLDRGVPIAADDEGQTPLHLAALSRQVEVLKLMLAKGSVDQNLVCAIDNEGRTALGCALASGADDKSLQMAKELIDHGASARQALVHVKDKLFALTNCIATEQRPASRVAFCWPQVLFLGEPPDVTLCDVKNRSCLAYAMRTKTYTLSYLQLIMSWATDANVARKLIVTADADGLTPLMHAVDRGNVGAVDALLQQAHKLSSDVLKEVMTAKAPDGTTALMRAVDCIDGTGLVCVLMRWMDDATVASVLGALDSEGRTALMRAVLRNSTPMVQVLLQGRPLQPLATEVSCPAMKMAGDKVAAEAIYQGSAGGGPNFTISWIGRPAVFSQLPVHATARQADGCSRVALHPDSSSEASEYLPNGTLLRVVAVHGLWAQVEGSFGQGWAKLIDVQASGDKTDYEQGQCLLRYPVELTMPPGTGPGVKFSVVWDNQTGGPGLPGLASGFAGTAACPSRTPSAVLDVQDHQGRNALHLCITPLPFGSFENVEMLSALVKAGVPTACQNMARETPADLASRQRSGKMLHCLRDLGVAVPCAQPMDVDDNVKWPEAVDLEADSLQALEAAAATQLKASGKAVPPVEKHFQKPSAASNVKVAYGADGAPLDLVMTKVDLTRGPCPQNVYYRMQVLHELNQDNYFLFTRWGRIGDRGQFQTTPFESLGKAAAEFGKIFKSKAGNDWADRANFTKKHLKYQLHDLKYPTIGVSDALCMDKWVWLPAKATPLQLRRLLNVGTSKDLLANSLLAANIDQPLGSLKKKPLTEARDLLEQIKVHVRQHSEEKRKSEPSGEKLQTILDAIAAASSRIYELVPTRNFQHANVAPIDNSAKVKQWISRLEETDDIVCAARVLLGAQAQLKSMSPTDYVYRALGIYAEPLASDSAELQLIERYINRSAFGECTLYSGEGATPLPEKPKRKLTKEEEEALLPRWQALQDTICYTSADCKNQHHAGLLAKAGSTFKEYGTNGTAICIRKSKDEPEEPSLWIQPVGADGSQVLLRLSERECASKVAAIYRVGRKGEEDRAGGDTATLFFHGSGIANLLSILSQGLRVKPPGAMHHGSAFGNGVYFANAYAKSRGYCSFQNGVGFMLLCEVATGRTLKSSQFGFQQAVREARIEAARERLGLLPNAPVQDHPDLMAAVKEIDREIELAEEIEDLTGTNYDSFHFKSSGAPDPCGDVVHPDGYTVPCGQIVSGGFSSNCASDEIIVYQTSRVRVRYVVELRGPDVATFVQVKKPEDQNENEDKPDTGGEDKPNEEPEDKDMDANEEEDEDNSEDDE